MAQKNYSFAQQLRQAREKSGLSQEELARAADVSTNTYRNWEYGQSQPRVDQVLALAKAMGVSTEWLLDGTEIWEVRQIEPNGPVLPLLGEIACDFQGITNEYLQQAPVVGVDPNWIKRGARYVVRACGQSMTRAGIDEGDLVGLTPDDGTKGINEESIYGLLIWNDQECEGVTLKFLLEEEGVIWAVPANGELRPRPLSRLGDRVEVFGRVIGVSKEIE
jgi:SOS-response transcriptional repressor LexA